MSKIIQCDKCLMKFSANNSLKRHIENIHLKEKNFKCEFCEFTCNHKPNLKKHSCYVTKNMKIITDLESSQYSIEYGISKRLELELNAKRVSCPFGRIDLMTTDTIIEIKKWDEHKKAIGQVIGYAIYYPFYKKRIHFFGSKPTISMEKALREVCSKLNIEITEEPEIVETEIVETEN